MRRFILNTLVFAVGIFFGCLFYPVVQNAYAISFEAKFTLGDVISASTALLLGVLVTYYLQRQTKSDEVEKELLLHELDSISLLLQEFQNANIGAELSEITASLKRLSVACNSFRDLLTDLKYSEEVQTKGSFEQLVVKIRRFATETPIREIEKHARKARCNATVKDGIISLTQERKQLLEQQVDLLKSAIIRCKIEINKA